MASSFLVDAYQVLNTYSLPNFYASVMPLHLSNCHIKAVLTIDRIH